MIAGLAVCAFSSAARACPDCPTAVEARAQLLADHPALWFSVALLPFAIMFLLSARLHRLSEPERREDPYEDELAALEGWGPR